jgi:glucan phosphoethanolaminetransferase (alkaline phosphatase superfamily)
MICKKCKRDIGENVEYCPICGEPTSKEAKEQDKQDRKHQSSYRPNTIFLSLIFFPAIFLLHSLYEFFFVLQDEFGPEGNTIGHMNYPGGEALGLITIFLIFVCVICIIIPILIIIFSLISHRKATLRFVKLLHILGILLLIFSSSLVLLYFLQVIAIDNSPYYYLLEPQSAYIDCLFNAIDVLFAALFYLNIRKIYINTSKL